MLGGRKGVLVIGILGAVLSLVFFASVVHAQTQTTSAANATTSSSQACTGLGTPQEDGNCQGTGQFGDQTGPDTESASVSEVDG